MEFTGVYHRTTEQMSYALNESELIVNLRTGYDVRQVFILEILLRQGFLEEKKNESGQKKRLSTKSA
mgnify:CR=1 FL=1